MKFGRLMLNKMPITAIWSKSKLEIEFQYGGRLFFANRKQLYLSSRGMRDVDEIWFADRF